MRKLALNQLKELTQTWQLKLLKEYLSQSLLNSRSVSISELSDKVSFSQLIWLMVSTLTTLRSTRHCMDQESIKVSYWRL